jgi:hypothetical protein
LVFIAHERVIKRALAIEGGGDCAAVGSSRMMEITTSDFTAVDQACQRFLNLGVSGGAYEDEMTLAYLAAGTNGLHHIMFGIDPWTFRLNADDRYTEFGTDYRSAKCFFEIGPCELFSVRGLLRSGVRRAWILVSKGRQPGRAFKLGSFRNDDEATIDQDGTYKYSKTYIRQSAGKWYEPHLRYKIAAPAVDSSVVLSFGKMIAVLKERRIRVSFFLAPYHPRVFRCEASETCAALNETEQAARDLARKLDVAVFGSYYPSTIEQSQFMSDMFPQPSAVKQLLYRATVVPAE